MRKQTTGAGLIIGNHIHTSCLRTHLKIGDPGLAMKSPSCPPITNSLSLATTHALQKLKSEITKYCSLMVLRE
jgi:hypothetical protein